MPINLINNSIKIFMFLLSIQEVTYAKLPIPTFNEKNYIRTITGLRPIRSTGIRIEHEKFKNKEIIHNYGHGGSGVTLSWGSAKYAVQILNSVAISNKEQVNKIAIIGGGIIGLTTAIELLDNGYDVTVYTKEEPNKTTATAAVAFIKIYALGTIGNQNTLKKYVEDQSLIIFNKLANSYNPRFPGAEIKTMYSFKCGAKDFIGVSEHIPELHPPKDCSIKKKHFLMLDTNKYIESLYGYIKNHSKAKISFRYIKKIEELQHIPEKFIFNCTGYGSRMLFHDTDVEALKGHMLEFENTLGIRYSIGVNINDKFNFVMVPWKNRIMIGPTEELTEDLAVDHKITDKLWDNANKFMIKLANVNK